MLRLSTLTRKFQVQYHQFKNQDLHVYLAIRFSSTLSSLLFFREKAINRTTKSG